MNISFYPTLAEALDSLKKKVKRWMTTSTTANYGEDLWAVYLDSGYKGKLVEMTAVR
jgi:hypothetical protein